MIVLDSSFLIAYRNAGDVHHRRAAEAYERIAAGEWGPVLLPEYVFLETVTVTAARKGLREAVAFGQELLEAREAELVPCSPYFVPAFRLFRNQGDTSFSFVDAAIVHIARARGATHIATFDADFRKVPGLTVVPSGG